VRVERVVLEHHRDVARLGRHVVDDLVADADLALGDFLEAGDHAKERRLAAARRPDEHAELAVGDRDVDARITCVAPKCLCTDAMPTAAMVLLLARWFGCREARPGVGARRRC
jgi:hypothetical protein